MPVPANNGAEDADDNANELAAVAAAAVVGVSVVVNIHVTAEGLNDADKAC